MNNILVKVPLILIQLCVLRESPSALPYSRPLLGGLLLVEFVLQVFTLSRYTALTFFEASSATFLYLALLVGGVYFLLARRKQAVRTHKVLIAFLGTELLLTGLMRLMLVMLPMGNLSFAPKLFLIWQLVVKGKILREALGIGMAAAILTTMGLYMVISLPIFLMLITIEV